MKTKFSFKYGEKEYAFPTENSGKYELESGVGLFGGGGQEIDIAVLGDGADLFIEIGEGAKFFDFFIRKFVQIQTDGH